LAVRLGVDGSASEAMCGYLCNHAFPRLLASTGVVACHLFATDAQASFVNTAESSTRPFDVPAWVFVCEASTAEAASDAVHVVKGEALARLNVQVRPDFAVYSLEVCRLA
jgi:hypothetical protein